MISRKGLLKRLLKGPNVRNEFVASQIGKALAFQIRALRDREGWSQEELARRVGTNQNAISRLENPYYGKPTTTTLKRIAAAFDVALIIRFVPYGQLVSWVTGTPFVDKGLSHEALAVPSFQQETASFEADQEPAIEEYRYASTVPSATALVSTQFQLKLSPPNVIPFYSRMREEFAKAGAVGLSQPTSAVPAAADIGVEARRQIPGGGL